MTLATYLMCVLWNNSYKISASGKIGNIQNKMPHYIFFSWRSIVSLIKIFHENYFIYYGNSPFFIVYSFTLYFYCSVNLLVICESLYEICSLSLKKCKIHDGKIPCVFFLTVLSQSLEEYFAQKRNKWMLLSYVHSLRKPLLGTS